MRLNRRPLDGGGCHTDNADKSRRSGLTVSGEGGADARARPAIALEIRHIQSVPPWHEECRLTTRKWSDPRKREAAAPMEVVNMRSDTVVFDLEDERLHVVQRVVLPAQSPVTEVSLAGITRIRNAGPAPVIVNTDEGFVTLQPNETLLVTPTLTALIVLEE